MDSVILSIVPWIIWWKIADKRRLHELFVYGAVVAICAISLDNVGTDLLWWEYPDKLFQVVRPLFPADITLVPIFMMIGYQFTHTWRSFILVNVILDGFMAYVGEPLIISLDFYQLNTWKLWYSLVLHM